MWSLWWTEEEEEEEKKRGGGDGLEESKYSGFKREAEINKDEIPRGHSFIRSIYTRC